MGRPVGRNAGRELSDASSLSGGGAPQPVVSMLHKTPMLKKRFITHLSCGKALCPSVSLLRLEKYFVI
jgi:hypothetical protein